MRLPSWWPWKRPEPEPQAEAPEPVEEPALAPEELLPPLPDEFPDLNAERERQQAAIAARAEELILTDAGCRALLLANPPNPNEARHRAQMLADNELHGAIWEVE